MSADGGLTYGERQKLIRGARENVRRRGCTCTDSINVEVISERKASASPTGLDRVMIGVEHLSTCPLFSERDLGSLPQDVEPDSVEIIDLAERTP